MTPATGQPSAARSLVLIFGMPLVLAVLYYGWLAIQVGRMPYTWAQMDWDGDGRTSLREYFETAEVLERPAPDSLPGCVEFVHARTGKQLRITCPETAAP